MQRTLKIVSGGQTGADRAALDVAMDLGVAHGGWCPKGRLAEDGPIAERYGLRETPHADAAQRTEWNVRDSDATVVFGSGAELGEGTRLAIATAEALGRPLLRLRGDQPVEQLAARLREFLARHCVEVVNVAGPRASQDPQVAGLVRAVLLAALPRPRQ